MKPANFPARKALRQQRSLDRLAQTPVDQRRENGDRASITSAERDLIMNNTIFAMKVNARAIRSKKYRGAR